ncbi:MAG: DedA family protein, partial [Opitutaceae bacterium]|nr:DedA family protein [Opitutaceae bacterium]
IRAGFWKFLTLDGLAALISAPVFVFIGHWLGVTFGENWEDMQATLAKVKGLTTWVTVAAALAGAALIWWRWRKFRERRAGRARAPEDGAGNG